MLNVVQRVVAEALRYVQAASLVSDKHSFIHSFSILSDDRPKASSKTMATNSAI